MLCFFFEWDVWSLEGLSRGVTGHVFILISLLCSRKLRSGNWETGEECQLEDRL